MVAINEQQTNIQWREVTVSDNRNGRLTTENLQDESEFLQKMLREGSSNGMGNVEFENELPSFSEREREERERDTKCQRQQYRRSS